MHYTFMMVMRNIVESCLCFVSYHAPQHLITWGGIPNKILILNNWCTLNGEMSHIPKMVISNIHDSDNIIGPDGTLETGLAHSQIKDFLQMLKSCFPIVMESEFCITKYHQCLHFPHIIMEHRSAKCRQCTTRINAKKNLKDPAKHTHWHHSNLSYQTGILDMLNNFLFLTVNVSLKKIWKAMMVRTIPIHKMIW